jgi:hypothetical protein
MAFRFLLRRIHVRLATLAMITAVMTLLPADGRANTLSFSLEAVAGIGTSGPSGFDVGGIEQITFAIFSDPTVFAATGADAVIDYDISYNPKELADCVAPSPCGGYVDYNIFAANGALSTGIEGSYSSQQNDVVTFGNLTGTLSLPAGTYAVTANAESAGYGPDLTTTGSGSITAEFNVVQGDPVFISQNPEPGTMVLFLFVAVGWLARRAYTARLAS